MSTESVEEGQGQVGRPSKYRPEFVEQARKLALLGAIDREIADFFGIAESTLNNWKLEHPEFLESLKSGKEVADDRVERSLYHRAIGYSHDAVKMFQAGGEVISESYVEHYPPDTTAAIFWLKNRRPAQWRDKVQQELSGPDGQGVSSIEVRFVSAGEKLEESSR